MEIDSYKALIPIATSDKHTGLVSTTSHNQSLTFNCRSMVSGSGFRVLRQQQYGASPFMAITPKPRSPETRPSTRITPVSRLNSKPPKPRSPEPLQGPTPKTLRPKPLNLEPLNDRRRSQHRPLKPNSGLLNN